MSVQVSSLFRFPTFQDLLHELLVVPDAAENLDVGVSEVADQGHHHQGGGHQGQQPEDDGARGDLAAAAAPHDHSRGNISLVLSQSHRVGAV